jgi:hypothetical protein
MMVDSLFLGLMQLIIKNKQINANKSINAKKVINDHFNQTVLPFRSAPWS